MSKGLNKILEKIKEDPSRKMLKDRYLALVSELSDADEKEAMNLNLAEVYLAEFPQEALEIAHGVQRNNKSSLRALTLIESSLRQLGKAAKADVIQNEIDKLKAAAEANNSQSSEALTPPQQTDENVLNQSQKKASATSVKSEPSNSGKVEAQNIEPKSQQQDQNAAGKKDVRLENAVGQSQNLNEKILSNLSQNGVSVNPLNPEEGIRSSRKTPSGAAALTKRASEEQALNTNEYVYQEQALAPSADLDQLFSTQSNSVYGQLKLSVLPEKQQLATSFQKFIIHAKIHKSVIGSGAEFSREFKSAFEQWFLDHEAVLNDYYPFLLFDLLQLLWGDFPHYDCAIFLKKTQLAMKHEGYWGLYLDCLISAGYSRKALYEIRSLMVNCQSMTWALVGWSRLPYILSRLNFRPILWQPDDGIALLKEHLARPLTPTCSFSVM